MKIADMHCDTISRILKNRRRWNPASGSNSAGDSALHSSFILRSNPFQVDLEKMGRSGYVLQNFAIFVDFGETEHPIQDCWEQIRIFQEEMAKNRDLISPAATYGEIVQNQREGKMSALMTLEEGALCQGSLERLRQFYDIGVRMMTFTWNYPNSLGDPAQNNLGRSHQGLTPLGMEFLEEMERLGMIPDVSHLSDQGIRDVCRLARKPFCASHSNARSLCPHGRNLPDTLIRGISERGGIIGANYYGAFLDPKPDSLGRFYSAAAKIADHIRHISNIGGISCIGLGSDFDGIDENLEMKDCSHMELLAQALHKKGFHESEIEKIFYKNVLGFYRETL